MTTARDRLQPPAWLSFGLFQLVWLACALGASRGSALPGLLAAAAAIGIHLASVPARTQALRAILLCALAGFAVESLLVASGLLRYAVPWPSTNLAPAWIIALWMTFGTTLEATRRLFRGVKVPMLAGMGAILGPLSYIAGVRLGALEFGPSVSMSLLGLSAAWAAALPMLLQIGEPPDMSRRRQK